MQLKKEFIELSNHFNKNINEDKLLFIGMFLNFYLTETNFKNQKEIKSKYYIIALIRIASMLKIEKEFKYDFSEGTEESYKNLPENISKKKKLLVLERKEGKETVVLDEELNEYIELKIEELHKKADETAAIDKNIEKINRFFYEIISDEIINQYFYDIISN